MRLYKRRRADILQFHRPHRANYSDVQTLQLLSTIDRHGGKHRYPSHSCNVSCDIFSNLAHLCLFLVRDFVHPEMIYQKVLSIYHTTDQF